MWTQQIDSMSLHTVISGLLRVKSAPPTNWERRSLAEVTLSLLYRAHVEISPPPKLSRSKPLTNLVDHVYDELKDFVSDAATDTRMSAAAKLAVNEWVSKDIQRVKRTYDSWLRDTSAEAWTRWAIERDWPYHVGRLGSLVDDAFFDSVAKVLGWSGPEKKRIKEEARNTRLVHHWSEECRLSGKLPPPDFLQGYQVSSLLRGRYYQELVKKQRGTYVWHPMRNYVCEPVVELTELTSLADRLVELYLAGLICFGAASEEQEESVVHEWAANIRKIRENVIQIPLQTERDRAVNNAVDLFRSCGLTLRGQKLEKALEWGTELTLNVIGMAAGIIAVAETGSHIAYAPAHTAAEATARPYVGAVAQRLQGMTTHSRTYLAHVARRGVERFFVVTDEEIEGEKFGNDDKLGAPGVQVHEPRRPP